MTSHTELTANQLVSEIADVMEEIRSTDGIPEATREICTHSLNAVHESMHGLALWLSELLEWAPLRPETRARVATVARELTDADADCRFDTVWTVRWVCVAAGVLSAVCVASGHNRL